MVRKIADDVLTCHVHLPLLHVFGVGLLEGIAQPNIHQNGRADTAVKIASVDYSHIFISFELGRMYELEG